MNVDADTIFCTFGDVNVNVWLDDVHIKNVVNLNIREGWVERCVEENGEVLINKYEDSVVTEILEGVVRLEIWGMSVDPRSESCQ